MSSPSRNVGLTLTGDTGPYVDAMALAREASALVSDQVTLTSAAVRRAAAQVVLAADEEKKAQAQRKLAYAEVNAQLDANVKATQAAATATAKAAEQQAAATAAVVADIEAASARMIELAAADAEAWEASWAKIDAAAAAGSGKFAAAGEKIAGVGKISAAALVGIGVESIKSAGNFQQSTELYRTQAGQTQAAVEQAQKGIMALSTQVAYSPQSLAQSMYAAVSAGHDVADSLTIQKAAAEGARNGNADLSQTTDALVGVMKSLNAPASDATNVMAQIDAIVGSGKMTMDDFTTALKSGVVPAVASAGVDLHSLGAALAFMTDQGVPADQAATRLRTTVALMASPTTEAAKALTAIGMSGPEVKAATTDMANALAKAHITTTTLSEDLRKPDGLQVALQDLMTHLKAAGLSADAASALLGKAFGGGKTDAAVLDLINNLTGVQQKYQQIGTISGNFASNVAATTHTAAYQYAQLKAQIDGVGVQLGEKLLPTVQSVASWFDKDNHAATAAKAAMGALVVATTAWAAEMVIALGPLDLAVAAVGLLTAGLLTTNHAANSYSTSLQKITDSGKAQATSLKELNDTYDDQKKKLQDLTTSETKRNTEAVGNVRGNYAAVSSTKDYTTALAQLDAQHKQTLTTAQQVANYFGVSLSNAFVLASEAGVNLATGAAPQLDQAIAGLGPTALAQVGDVNALTDALIAEANAAYAASLTVGNSKGQALNHAGRPVDKNGRAVSIQTLDPTAGAITAADGGGDGGLAGLGGGTGTAAPTDGGGKTKAAKAVDQYAGSLKSLNAELNKLSLTIKTAEQGTLAQEQSALKAAQTSVQNAQSLVNETKGTKDAAAATNALTRAKKELLSIQTAVNRNPLTALANQNAAVTSLLGNAGEGQDAANLGFDLATQAAAHAATLKAGADLKATKNAKDRAAAQSLLNAAIANESKADADVAAAKAAAAQNQVDLNNAIALAGAVGADPVTQAIVAQHNAQAQLGIDVQNTTKYYQDQQAVLEATLAVVQAQQQATLDAASLANAQLEASLTPAQLADPTALANAHIQEAQNTVNADIAAGITGTQYYQDLSALHQAQLDLINSTNQTATALGGLGQTANQLPSYLATEQASSPSSYFAGSGNSSTSSPAGGYGSGLERGQPIVMPVYMAGSTNIGVGSMDAAAEQLLSAINARLRRMGQPLIGASR